MGKSRHDVIDDVCGGHNEMGNRPISYQNVALQIFYASIFYPFANFRQSLFINTFDGTPVSVL